MKNRKIEVALGRTVNTGNYESLKIHVSLAGDIGDAVSLDHAYDEAFEVVEKELLKREDELVGR